MDSYYDLNNRSNKFNIFFISSHIFPIKKSPSIDKRYLEWIFWNIIYTWLKNNKIYQKFRIILYYLLPGFRFFILWMLYVMYNIGFNCTPFSICIFTLWFFKNHWTKDYYKGHMDIKILNGINGISLYSYRILLYYH